MILKSSWVENFPDSTNLTRHGFVQIKMLSFKENDDPKVLLSGKFSR